MVAVRQSTPGSQRDRSRNCSPKPTATQTLPPSSACEYDQRSRCTRTSSPRFTDAIWSDATTPFTAYTSSPRSAGTRVGTRNTSDRADSRPGRASPPMQHGVHTRVELDVGVLRAPAAEPGLVFVECWRAHPPKHPSTRRGVCTVEKRRLARQKCRRKRAAASVNAPPAAYPARTATPAIANPRRRGAGEGLCPARGEPSR